MRCTTTINRPRDDNAWAGTILTDLLHNTGLALREGDMATRLIRDELDLNLSSLATRLIIIIVVVVGGRWSLALHATIIPSSSD